MPDRLAELARLLRDIARMHNKLAVEMEERHARLAEGLSTLAVLADYTAERVEQGEFDRPKISACICVDCAGIR